MTRIHLERIAHSYLGEPRGDADWALRELDMVFEDGRAYALLGPSGCGKTTLLNIVSGLIRPTRGRVLYDDRDVTLLTPAQRNIAQVFQFPVVYDTMTVAENLAFPLLNRGLRGEAVSARVAEVAGMLELDPILDRRAAGLTADQKQKISLGRGLVREDVAAILFDEPLTVVDPHLKWLLRRKLKEVHARYRHTLVYVTHDQNEALTFADLVIVMYEGEIVQVGTPQELFERPAHRFVGWFIGSPGMNFLPCHLKADGLGIDGTEILVGGEWFEAAKLRPDARLELGIRPEFLEVAEREDADTVSVPVISVEDLGNYRQVTAALGPHRVVAKVPEERPVPPDRVHLRFAPRWTRLYADGRLVV